MAEQESVQTQLDCLRFDVVGLQQRELARDRDILDLVKGRQTQAENMRDLGRTLVREYTLLSRLVIQHETFVRDTVKALDALRCDVDLVAVSATKLVRHITRVEKELHLLRDTVASLQQDAATLEKMVGDHIDDSTFDGAMKVRLQNLEDKFKLMEESTGIEYNPWYCEDETDEGGAERAEMDYERQVQAEKDYARQALRED